MIDKDTTVFIILITFVISFMLGMYCYKILVPNKIDKAALNLGVMSYSHYDKKMIYNKKLYITECDAEQLNQVTTCSSDPKIDLEYYMKELKGE